MNDSRRRILAAMRAHALDEAPLPTWSPGTRSDDADHVRRFMDSVESAAGRVRRVDTAASMEDLLRALHSDASRVVDVTEAVPAERGVDPASFEDVDVLACRGHLGVAENGAVWVTETRVPHPAALFLAQHLVLVVRAEDIVADMHAAYERLGREPVPGFGTFIAGPSKTADIEQALVVGAHGPRTLTVLLVDVGAAE